MTNYHLIKKDGTIETFTLYSDLYNAHVDEYGFFPIKAKVSEGNNLYYQVY